MKESNYTKQALPKWQKKHPDARVMRNNTGMAWQGERGYYTEIQGHKGIHRFIIKNPRPIFFGVGFPVKDEKTGRTKQKGGGDYIGWESIVIAHKCCGSCLINKNCNLLYNQIYPQYKCEGLTFIYKKLGNCYCNGKIYVPNYPKQIAVFLNLEIKSKDGKESPDQIRFRKAVQEAGGISIVLQEGKDDSIPEISEIIVRTKP